MKKFSKLLAVVLAIAVVICPMTSAIVANATSGGSYSIVAEDANNVVLTINSNDGFIVYQATVTFNSDSAFQNTYSSDSYTNGLKVIDYTLVSGSKDAYNAPAISAQQNGASLVLLVSATDAACLDLYSKVQIGIRVASGSTANLTKIQAADEGTVEDDPSLLSFGAKVGADGTVTLTDNADATTGTSHAHNFTTDAPYEVTAPTCTAVGTYRKTCTVCGAVDSSSTYAGSVMAAHTPSNVQNATNDFLASAATCTAPASYNYECTVCHAAITSEMAGYTGTFTSGTALGHNMTTHSANAADCTTPGNSLYYSCDRCNKYFSDSAGNTEIAANSWVIAATGHTPVTDAAVAATCNATGKTAGSHCSVCGAVITAQETVAIDPTNHTNIVNDAAVAPTCVATGKTAGSHCADCGATIVAQETVAATGVHTYGEYVSDGNATCGADGTKTRTCSVCGATDTVTDTGSATGEHTYGEYVSDGNATCAADGTKTRTCSVCGNTDTVTDTGSALGHAYTYTDNGDGTHDVGCSRCDYALAAQPCVDENDDNTCDLCGADLTPAGPVESVLDASIVTLTPQIEVAETINVIFRATKATTTANASYASTGMVISAQRYNNDGNIYTDDPVVAEFYSLTSKNNGAKFYDVPLQALDLTITAYVACYNALGEEVAHSANVVCTPVDLLKGLYSASPANETAISLNKFVTDALNLGTSAQVYFASRIAGDCDLKNATYINADWDQTYASGALTELADVSSIDWNPSSSITSSTNNITFAADLNGAPAIMFNIMRAAPTGAAPLDFSKLSMTVSYNTLAANNGEAGTISDTIEGSEWNAYVQGKNIRYPFKSAAMYDSNKPVTAVITYDGVQVCTATYSLDSYILANKDNASVGQLLTAVGRFSGAARGYFAAKLSKTV